MGNSIEEDIKKLEEEVKRVNKINNLTGTYVPIHMLESFLSDYKRVLKEDEEKTTILLVGAEKVKQLEKENEELKRLHIQDNKHLDFIMEHSIPIQKVKDNLIKYQEEYELLLEHQSGKESNRTKYLRGRIHMCQELLEGRK